jgi:hypothetical protein
LGRRALKLLAVTVLLVCIGSHVSELLDTWDHTFETGHDLESALIILALTVGAALALASATVELVSKTKSFQPVHLARAFAHAVSELIVSTHSPPVIPLRI